jgi:hypothetical protein
VSWDAATLTLVVQSDELLQQHSRYLLVVTDGVRDLQGKKIRPAREDDDGSIDSTEGCSAVGANNIVGSRDGLRQTVVDLMQLVRQIEAGMDVDGDGSVDLDARRIYYAGQSFGGIYGTLFLGAEPLLKAGVPNVPGGSIAEVARLGGFRFLTALSPSTPMAPGCSLRRLFRARCPRR